MDTQRKVLLIVDDEEINRKVLSGFVEALGYDHLLASSGVEALELLNVRNVDLVLLDVMMPGMDGFEVVRHIRAQKRFADLPVLMATALGDKRDRLEAVSAGANDFVTKPIDVTEMRIRLDAHLRLKAYHDEVRSYQQNLERLVEERTCELERAQQAKVAAHLETLRRLSSAAEYKDEETAHHIERMSGYSALLAAKAGLSTEAVDLILHASPMHDIGKIGIPDHILLKPGPLDPEEWKVMKTHAAIGAAILDSPSSGYLEKGRIIALSHHERWDGSGYPNGLAGEEIPLEGRICALADVFDALTSVRPYKERYSNAKALEIMREGRGSHFEPRLLDLFLEHVEEFIAIQEQYRD
ncbi:MAG: two-component system response regulator [Desulfovibrionaceae bacterium]